MLSLPQLQNVCLIYQGAKECRYLGHDDVVHGNCVCLKKVTAKKSVIDKQIDKFVEKAQQKGQDPAQMGRPLGNNCAGYHALRHIKQGYDVTP